MATAYDVAQTLSRYPHLSKEKADSLAQAVLDLAPGVSNASALYELVTGKTATGDDADRFFSAIGLVPVVGGVLKKGGQTLHAFADAGKAIDVGKIAETAGSAAAKGAATAPKVTIKDHYDHHLNMVDDIKDQLSSQGFRVSEKEISFGSSCGTGRCRPDIVAEAPDGTLRIIEVETGSADLSIRQSEIFPQIKDGSSIPRGKVAESFGLTPSVLLKEQGYPNGIPIEIMNFPGAK